MENNNQPFCLKQIKDKGNGQAAIYIDKKYMDELNLEIGDVVKVQPKLRKK